MPSSLLYLAALAAGISYWFADALTTAGPLHVVWKGAGVGLLALWAATQPRTTDGWLVAVAFAVYAAADVLIETSGLIAGAATFVIGHLLMIGVYLRHRRPLRGRDRAIAALLLIGVPLVSFQLPDRRADAIKVALYATVLGAMAVAALASTFRREWVLAGALLFVASDLLIFARLGTLSASPLPGLLIWPLYFAGQALVVAGVARKLRSPHNI